MWLQPFAKRRSHGLTAAGGASRADLDGLDPAEPVIASSPGPHASPWHPRDRSADRTVCHRLCVLGGSGAGKSALLHRVVSRRWEREYRPTRSSVQLFWSPPREVLDGLFELEDTPGVPAARASAALSRLLDPLLWYEKRRADDDARPPVALSGPDALANAIATERKRVGFVVVAALDDAASFELAHTIIEAIHGRLDYDAHADGMRCPVSIVVAATKLDVARSGVGAARRAVPSEAVVRQQLRDRYSHAVGYVECSAADGTGLRDVFRESVRRVGEIPDRHSIRAARARGIHGRGGSPFAAPVMEWVGKAQRLFAQREQRTTSPPNIR